MHGPARYKYVVAHAQILGGALAALTGQAFNAKVTQPHACQLTGAVCGLCGSVAAADHQTICGGCAELVLLVGSDADAGAGRSAVLHHIVQDGCAYLVDGLTAGDILLRVGVEAAADGSDVSDALTFRSAGGLNLGLTLCFGLSLDLRTQFLNVRLKGVELAGLVLGHVAACGAGSGQDILLTLHFLLHKLSLVHALFTSC